MGTLIEEFKNKPHYIYGEGASEEEILKAEKKIGVKFSEEYKEYLRTFGRITVDGIEFTGITDKGDKDVANETLEMLEWYPGIDEWYPKNPMYLLFYTGMDNIYYWQNTAGEVYQTDGYGEPWKEFDSILDFLLLLDDIDKEENDE